MARVALASSPQNCRLLSPNNPSSAHPSRTYLGLPYHLSRRRQRQGHLTLPKLHLCKSIFVAMSFLGGAECSTAGNPLTQFTKHVQSDNTLQRDRLVGRGSGGLEEGMRSFMASNPSDKVTTVIPQSLGTADPLADDKRLSESVRPIATALRNGTTPTRPPQPTKHDPAVTFTRLGPRNRS